MSEERLLAENESLRKALQDVLICLDAHDPPLVRTAVGLAKNALDLQRSEVVAK